MPQGWQPAPPVDLSGVVARLEALEARAPAGIDAAAIEARLAALEAALATAPGSAEVEGLAQRLDALEQQRIGADLAAILARLEALETAPPPPAPDLAPLADRVAALESIPSRDLAPLAARIDALEAALPDLVARAAAGVAARIEGRAAELAASAAEIDAARHRAAALAALGALGLALDQGTPAPEAVAALAAVLEPPPDGLQALAEGVPTRAALLQAWPAAARAALAAAPPDPDESGLVAFLRRQVGARSLTPREGGSADAVLSRAEAALRSGDLGAALAELDALAPEAQAALADWRAGALGRLAAERALDAARAALQAD